MRCLLHRLVARALPWYHPPEHLVPIRGSRQSNVDAYHCCVCAERGGVTAAR
jgi:hypothetical protein